MEDDGSFFVTSGNERMEARRDNATLFMFWGDLASRNHIFLQIEPTDEENRTFGTYLFDPDCDWFDRVAAHMIDTGFTAHINMHEIPDCDEDAYQKYITQRSQKEIEEAGDFLPDDWLGDGTN